MKLKDIIFLLFAALILNSCASGYKMINPTALNYQSTSTDKSVSLEYKYNLLQSRYARKETNNKVRLAAVKIVNNSGKDLVFGRDIKIAYANDNTITLMEADKVYATLKQGSIGYLLYLLLTPAKFTTTSNNMQTSSTPVGYVIGPGLAFGNMIAAGSANNNFKAELLKYNINGAVIKNGESVYGLIGFESDSFDALKIKVN